MAKPLRTIVLLESILMAISLSGAASWFNHGAGEPGPGPADPGNSNQASGISFFQPGIAVARSDTLRGWWRVTDSHGKSFVVQQTDFGPAAWTGRVVDFTYSARQAFLGGRDPTGEHFQLEYLGQNKPADAGVATGPSPVSTTPAAPAAPTAAGTTGIDQAAFDKANRAYIAGSFISKNSSSPYKGVPGLNFGSGGNALFQSGLLRTTPPNPADFMTSMTSAQQSLQALTGGTGAQVQQHPQAANQQVQAMVTMANSLLGKPYVWGGGHGSFGTASGGGLDCSGFVSAVLHAGGYLSSPVTTDSLPGSAGIQSGRGQWVTIYDRVGGGSAHVIIEINGQFYESGGSSGPWGGGGGVQKIGRPSDSYLSSFGTILHPQGL